MPMGDIVKQALISCQNKQSKHQGQEKRDREVERETGGIDISVTVSLKRLLPFRVQTRARDLVQWRRDCDSPPSCLNEHAATLL